MKFESYFYAKIIVVIILTNSLSSFILFCPFAETIRIKFSANWWSGNEKHFYFLLIANHALFERYGEFNILL